MHEDSLKIQAVWKKEQVRDQLLAEWSRLNAAVKRLKDEQQAKADESATLEEQQEEEQLYRRGVSSYTGFAIKIHAGGWSPTYHLR